MRPPVPRVLVIDHHDSYTYNLVHLIASVTGSVPDVVQHDDPARGRWRDGYTHIVLSPGPGTVTDPDDFAMGRAVIVASDVPVLGVCLGLQGMVHELGGSVDVVEPAHGEISSVTHNGLGLFSAVPQGFSVVRYHSRAALVVPPELRVTAWCEGPSGSSGQPVLVVMAVQHMTRPLAGVQFHPESVLTEHGALLVGNFLAMS
jgi:anthranilate synthase component 2